MLGISAGMAWACVALAAACSDDPNPATTRRDAGAAEGGDGSGSPTPEQLFRALQGELVQQCGGTNGVCHVNGTFKEAPKWLSNPDPYVSAKAYRGILPASGDPHDSLLLTQVEHTGTSLQSIPQLFDRVRQWVGAELATQTEKLAATTPVSVATGPNILDLAPLGPGLEGAQLTFVAQINGSVLSLSNMRLQAGAGASVRIDSPFFVVVPQTGKVVTDPVVNGFSGELVAPKGGSTDFYNGAIILIRWEPTAKLKLVFRKIQSFNEVVEAGPSGQCTALDSFKTNAVPAFQQSVPLVEGGTQTCFFCHSGGSDSAKAALDLTLINSDPAAACAQTRNFVNFQDKTKSIVILNPTGQANPNHPVQALDPNGAVVNGIRAWVNAEQP